MKLLVNFWDFLCRTPIMTCDEWQNVVEFRISGGFWVSFEEQHWCSSAGLDKREKELRAERKARKK